MESVNFARRFGLLLLGAVLSAPATYAAGTPLDLRGYVDDRGAISVQYQGDTIDPYFALQALLLARDLGLDISAYANNWATWMLERQKPDATFDRYCRNGPVWAPCKTADADDALLALWLRFLDTMPADLARNEAWRQSYERSVVTLSRLLDPARGVFLVSPVYQHALFMDNLEVLSYPPRGGGVAALPAPRKLAENIQRAFWDGKTGRYLVSTQLGQKGMAHAFYPEAVAQIYPLLFDFKPLPRLPQAYYRNWIREHRAVWLTQSREDFAWGLLAVAALRQNDRVSAACWLRESAAAWRTGHWIVTDEVVRQALANRGIAPAGAHVPCG